MLYSRADCPPFIGHLRSTTSCKHILSPPFLSGDGKAGADSSDQSMSLFDIWKASRPCESTVDSDGKLETLPLQPGSQRQLTYVNILLACKIIHGTFSHLVTLLWCLNPIRTALFVGLTIVRGLLPAFRGYSQALILDEVSNFTSSKIVPQIERKSKDPKFDFLWRIPLCTIRAFGHQRRRSDAC